MSRRPVEEKVPGRKPARRKGWLRTVPKWLLRIWALMVMVYAASMVFFYRWPWGGKFDPDAAGSAAEWSASLITAMGLVGLFYQLSQIARDRNDETIREINSLYSFTSSIEWNRNCVQPGHLVFVYISNNGLRKARKVELELSISDTSGSRHKLPEDWMVDRVSADVLPSEMGEPIRVAVVHIPLSYANPIDLGLLTIRLNWIDAFDRRISMINNRSQVVGRVA